MGWFHGPPLPYPSPSPPQPRHATGLSRCLPTTQSTRRPVAAVVLRASATRSAGEEPSSPAASKGAVAMARPASAAAAAAALRCPHPSSSATTLPLPPPVSNGGGRVQFQPLRRGRAMHEQTRGSHAARASLGGLLGGVFGGGGRDDGEATRKKYADTVARINAMEPEFSALSDADLRARTAGLQGRARSGESLDSLLPVRTQTLRTLICFQ